MICLKSSQDTVRFIPDPKRQVCTVVSPGPEFFPVSRKLSDTAIRLLRRRSLFRSSEQPDNSVAAASGIIPVLKLFSLPYPLLFVLVDKNPDKIRFTAPLPAGLEPRPRITNALKLPTAAMEAAFVLSDLTKFVW